MKTSDNASDKGKVQKKVTTTNRCWIEILNKEGKWIPCTRQYSDLTRMVKHIHDLEKAYPNRKHRLQFYIVIVETITTELTGTYDTKTHEMIYEDIDIPEIEE